MASPALLGPPELYNPRIQSEPPPQAEPQSEATATDPFMDLLTANFNKTLTTTAESHPMGLTENNSATFLSSGNPCLDFFFHVVPDTPPESITQRLQLAWSHNPLTTLKLICNLRGVRGTGKSDKEGFYTTAFWLHNHHPKTLASNVPSFADFGYLKDLAEILYRLLEGPDSRAKQKDELLQRKSTRSYLRGHKKLKPSEKSKRVAKGTVAREIRVNNALEEAMMEKEKAKQLRHDKRIAMAKNVVQRLGRDPDFRFLYDKISDYFAECLRADIGFLNSREYRKISLAAKWCPSIDSSFDRSTLLCESIARKIFPRELYPEYQSIEEAHYAFRIRDRLRKEILVPLRKVLELPEVYIGANQWNAIPYNRVASLAMKLYKDKFLKHDEERFRKYLEDVKAGKSKIAAGALLPHEIISSGDEIAELQWKRMVDELLNKGRLKNCIAVSDVSGSMHGIPMEVSVALGLLVSELSEDPWKGKIITFSANPQLHLILGDDLRSKTEFVRRMDWGHNTDFQKVFDKILKVAVNGNLKGEQMIKRVFVFSDMEFDQASANDWETDYEAIKRKFREKGYEESVPEIVFWNLRDSRSTPVPGKQQGVALVSGFSKNLMNLFLGGAEALNPEYVMDLAISGEEYQRLVVVD
ncbi:uncharacterized protein LOC107435223 [Ziziphus jujuba]|uniref:Uncharacterized protein LOC107435223 n=1 Tax=Ziziphus jujuba TaxID=326968 RepID=A0A6P4B0V5_ZIZJJ|nr:uncharacterized protein LOC107435223 [Ziziphus jujuba]